jgi:RNA polymerase sigma-70 factor (ECF subfamily)
LSDKALLSDDARAFQVLLDDHGPVVMGVLRRLCRSTHDAEDVFQETAIRVWRGLAARPEIRSPRAWLLKIAYRAFLDTRRPRAAHGELPDLEDETQTNPAAAAELAEQTAELQAALESLPGPIREVIVLHYSGGLSLSEVAAAMEISLGTAKSRLNRALERMRKAM